MTTKVAPYVSLSWTATALGANFGGYNVYRRPTRAVVPAWTQIASITVPSGYTPANVEAQHNAFRDYEAGWALTGGQWTDGFDYVVTVINSASRGESALTSSALGVLQTPDTNPWIVSNQYPYLNFPIASLQMLDASDEPAMSEFRIAGRDFAVTRTQIELPPRAWVAALRRFDRLGEDYARVWRAAAAAGAQMCFHTPRGDRLMGTLEALTALPHEDIGTWTASGRILETARESNANSDFNLPPGVVTDGAASYVSVADAADLKPTTNPFTFFCTASFAASVNKYAMAKINAGQGFAIRTDGTGHLGFELNGSGGNGTAFDTVNAYNDAVHNVIVVAATGAQTMYRDGVSAKTATIAYTGITSTDALLVGAKSGASAFEALQPVRSFGYYARALTAAEIQNLSDYCHGVAGVRPPARAELFVDLRDQRTWDGTQVSSTVLDLSGLANNGVLTASPVTKGIPWNLAQIDRF